MKITLAKAFLIGWLPALLLLSGCVTQEVRKEDRTKIAVLKIDSNVSKPPSIYYMGPGSGKVLQDSAEQSGVLIEKIVMEEISTALRQSGKVKVSDWTDTSASAPVLKVHVTLYGFSIPHSFNMDLVPALSVTCDISDSRGKVLWRDKDRVSLLESPVKPIPREKLMTNPKVIEDAWRVAAKQIAENILEKLESQLDQPQAQ